MFKIINKQILSSNIKRLDISAPNIASKVKPGQFVNLKVDGYGSSFALSVIDNDISKGTITLIFEESCQATKKLGAMAITDHVHSILGPLGVPATVKKKGVVLCVATGLGSAKILPVIRALKGVGNKVIVVIGAKTKRDVLVEAQMRLSCDKLLIATNDGSYEKRGLAIDILKEMIGKQKINLVYTIGSAQLMQDVCQLTRVKKIKTFVQLNPIMVDCVGMCGACRVRVGDKTVLACVEGPEFDGHKVDFENYKIRLDAFKEELWNSQRDQFSHSRSDQKTLTKFLAGILKG